MDDLHAVSGPDYRTPPEVRFTPDSPKRGLITKLAEIMAEVGHVPKRGRNNFHNYDYVMEADLCDAVREKLAARSLMIVPSVGESTRTEVVSEKGRKSFLVDVRMHYRIIDGESGESLELDGLGCGEDSGDKGLYKALTGSNKYLLMKLFQIPTGDDPEIETKEQRRDVQKERREEIVRSKVEKLTSGAPQEAKFVKVEPVDAARLTGVVLQSGKHKGKDIAEIPLLSLQAIVHNAHVLIRHAHGKHTEADRAPKKNEKGEMGTECWWCDNKRNPKPEKVGEAETISAVGGVELAMRREQAGESDRQHEAAGTSPFDDAVLAAGGTLTDPPPYTDSDFVEGL